MSDRVTAAVRRDGGVLSPRGERGRRAGSGARRGAHLVRICVWGRRGCALAAAVIVAVPAAASQPLPGTVPAQVSVHLTAATVSAGTVSAGTDDVAGGPGPGEVAGLLDVYTRLGAGSVSAGTGVVVNTDGEFVTNNHVVAGGDRIVVAQVATRRVYRAVLLGADARRDVALLRLVGADDLPVALLGDSDELRVGDPVAAVGNVGGVGGDPTVTTGTVSALRRPVLTEDVYDHTTHQLHGMIEVDALVRPGDSGGPLLDGSGQVIGIDTAAGRGTGFAIPINTVIAIARRLGANIGPSPSAGPDTAAGQPPIVQVLAPRPGPDTPDQDRSRRGGVGLRADGLADISLGGR